MRCQKVDKVGQSTYLCSNEGYIYICDECNDNECNSCYKLEKPKLQRRQVNTLNINRQYGYAAEYGFDINTIKETITKKEFLIGAVVGLIVGRFLLCSSR